MGVVVALGQLAEADVGIQVGTAGVDAVDGGVPARQHLGEPRLKFRELLFGHQSGQTPGPPVASASSVARTRSSTGAPMGSMPVYGPVDALDSDQVLQEPLVCPGTDVLTQVSDRV